MIEPELIVHGAISRPSWEELWFFFRLPRTNDEQDSLARFPAGAKIELLTTDGDRFATTILGHARTYVRPYDSTHFATMMRLPRVAEEPTKLVRAIVQRTSKPPEDVAIRTATTARGASQL